MNLSKVFPVKRVSFLPLVLVAFCKALRDNFNCNRDCINNAELNYVA